VRWPSDEEGRKKKGKAEGTPSLGRPRNSAKDEYKRQIRLQDFVESQLSSAVWCCIRTQFNIQYIGEMENINKHPTLFRTN
jgi:hypothetical protein